MSTILNKLKDNNEYYHGVGKQYLSNSDIGALLNNPKMFGVSREDDINLARVGYSTSCCLSLTRQLTFQ